MEEIKWVTTPKCCECKTPWNLRNRYCCIGCDRTLLKEEAPNHKRTKKDRAAIKKKAEELRLKGYTISQIAQKLKIPRATAQRAAAAVKKSTEKGKVISLSSIHGQTCLCQQS